MSFWVGFVFGACWAFLAVAVGRVAGLNRIDEDD